METNITKYFIIPASTTQQERDDWESLFYHIKDLKDDPHTIKHSYYTEHADGRFCYAVNGWYENMLTEQEKIDTLPSKNFVSATDDTLYTQQYVENEGFFD